jgi:hypothetical protein
MAMNVSFLSGLDRSGGGFGMSEECAHKHFATGEKYQDAARLSTENGGSPASKRDCHS